MLGVSDPRRLDIAAVVATTEKLQRRVGERFGGRGIAELAGDLVELGRRTDTEVASLARPRWGLRLGVAAVVVAAVVSLVASAWQVDRGADVEKVNDWLALVEYVFQDIIFLGLGATFLARIEGNLKRRRALADLHELRSFAHVVDMHQLTKDPEVFDREFHPTQSSPARLDGPVELGRYLEYCSELLALTSKLAAAYAQASNDAVVLGAVREIQELVGLLSNKIWQKLVILDRPSPRQDFQGRLP